VIDGWARVYGVPQSARANHGAAYHCIIF